MPSVPTLKLHEPRANLFRSWPKAIAFRSTRCLIATLRSPRWSMPLSSELAPILPREDLYIARLICLTPRMAGKFIAAAVGVGLLTEVGVFSIDLEFSGDVQRALV